MIKRPRSQSHAQQSKAVANFKVQAAKSVADTIENSCNRYLVRQCFQKLRMHLFKEDTITQSQDQDDEVNNEYQRNPSFMNESKSERGFSRQILSNQPSMVPQRIPKKIDKDADTDKPLAISLNRSFTKPANYQKDQEGLNEKVSEFNPSDLKWPPQTNYEDDKKFKLDVFSVQTKSYVSSNLRVGDIIYLKHVTELHKKDGRPYRMVGILSGDGIASNRLECMNRNINYAKNANFIFKKSLFRIEASRKYYYQKLYHDMKNSVEYSDDVYQPENENKLNFLKKKYEEEKAVNDSEFRNQLGQPVLYGQTIHLKHLYSNSYLTLQPNSLSLQYGCVKLTLEEEGSEMSNFKFLASGNLKTKEDVVAYSDPVYIMSSREDYYMHVWDEINGRNTSENGLEVNGSESNSNWKLLRFMDFEEYQEYEANNNFVESGDIIRIVHKKTGASLTVPPKNLEMMTTNRLVIINNEAEDNGPQRTSIPTKFLENKMPLLPIDLESASKYTISDLWEVQRRNAFIGGFARFDETFRLKNLSTGLFLSQDPISERLKLTPDGSREECYFLFRPKKTDDKRHRIEYGDLLRIQTFNGNYLQQHRGKKEPGDLCGHKLADSARLLFHIEHSSEDLAQAANRLSSLFPCFLNFYCFLQYWGILVQSGVLQKDEVAIYTYAKALECEKDLDIETEALEEGLANLEDFIKNSDNLSFKLRQKLLIEQKMIDMLLLIAELIDTRTYGNRTQREIKKEEVKTYKSHETKTGEEETPQYIARKYLEKPVLHIYNILLLSTKNSTEVAYIILKNSEFLSRQFAFYRKEAGDLLKEAIKNSIHLGESDPHGEQILKWVALLDMIKETGDNIPLQTLYLEIISLACLDLHMRGVVKYQNKVLQEFFSPNSHFLKGLVTFAKRNGRVYVSFARKPEFTKEDFLELNPSLSPDSDVNNEEYEGKCFFSLQDISRSKLPGTELIIDYLATVLWLFYCLCKNRNQDGINHIKGIGLIADLLMSCMQDDTIHIKMKTNFILLYEDLFIDVEPYKSIKDCSNHCYIWEHVEEKKLSEYTHLWHSLANYNKVDWQKDYDKDKVKTINEFILQFWVDGKNIVRSQALNLNAAFANDGEYLQKARLIHAMLEFTKNAVNLGFTNATVNNQILYAITSLFAAFRTEKDRDKCHAIEEDNWIVAFVQSNPLSKRHDYFTQIYLEALEILQVMADLRVSLQVAAFLKIYKLCFEHGVSLDRESFNSIFSLFFQKYGLNVPVPKLIGNTERSAFDLDSHKLNIAVFNEAMNDSLNEIVKEITNPDTSDVIQSGSIFINMLSEISEKNKYLEKQARKVLKRYFDQRETLLENLRRIEIISGKKEIEIYTEFDSQERLEIQINRVLQDDDNLRQNYKIDSSSYKTRIIDINNSLNRMISRFKERKRDVKLTLKTQNIMRNLNIHKSVLKILKLSYREQEHKEVFKSAISVLYYFCKGNVDNQEELYSYVPDLLALIEKKLKPSKLIAHIFSNKKTSKECYEFIDKIFELLSNQDPNSYVIQPEYLIILRSFLIDDNKKPITQNQRIILSRLMKNKNFLSIFDYRVPDRGRANETKEEDIITLYYQMENILLLANLALETRLGIIQAKKILSFDQIKSLLLNITSPVPYLQKKVFLRYMFQIYITKWADLNNEFDHKSMVEILSTLVLPDLKVFEKYLEGLIPVPDDNAKRIEEKNKKAQELRDTIKRYRTTNYEGSNEKGLIGLLSMSKKTLPPIANNNNPESKKILRNPSEYWEYLSSGKSWVVKQDGLLYFLLDCFREIESRNWLKEGDNLKEVLGFLKVSLMKMSDALLKVEEEINKDGPTVRLTKYTVLINECIDRIPDKKGVKVQKTLLKKAETKKLTLIDDTSNLYEYDNKMDEQTSVKDIKDDDQQPEDPLGKFLQKIKAFINIKKITLEEFIAHFKDTEDKITTDEFRSKLKTLLGNLVRLDEIEDFIINIRRSKKGSHEIDNTVSLGKVYRKLQKSFERDRAAKFKEIMKEDQGTVLENLDSPDSLNILRSIKNFIEQYIDFNLNNEESNTELREIVNSLVTEPKKRITKKKVEEYQTVISKLLKIFKKKHYEIYLLRMLKYLLVHFEKVLNEQGKSEVNDSDSDDEEKEAQILKYREKERFKQIQLVFAQSECLGLCLSCIKEGVHKKIIFEAVELMNLMLKKGNRQVQTHILEVLKKSPSTSGFFNFIKLQLWQTVDSFKKLKEAEALALPEKSSSRTKLLALKNPSPEMMLDLRITENLIILTQLFSENCFTDFQNFLRSQVSTMKTSIVSSNLVSELSNFLVDLQLTDPNVFQDPRMLPLVVAALEALTDFCMGPCQENQKLLASQRHLIAFINSLLDKDINFQSSNDNDLQMVEIFSIIIKLLRALKNGNKDTVVKEFLLEQLSVDALIRKLVIIYTTKIANRDINIFRQEKRCPQGRSGQHMNGCGENYCVINWLTAKDFLITETAFNLYILLTMFTEEFVDNFKLEKFKYDRLNPEEKARLRYFENKYKSYFSDKKKKKILNVSTDLLLQYSNSQLKKNQIIPSREIQTPAKFRFPVTGRLNEDDPLFSPDSSSVEALNPSSPDLLLKKGSISGNQISPGGVTYRGSGPDQIVTNAAGLKTFSTLERDLHKLQEEEMFREYFSLKERYIISKARKFFRTFINSVEINQDGQLSRNFFQVPFECDYITRNIRDHLVFNANRNSDSERLEHLFFNVPRYRAELEHRQKISRHPFIEWFVKRWRLFQDIAYLFVLANNIIFIASYEAAPDGTLDISGSNRDLSSHISLAFSIIQISLSVLILIFGIYERLPISLFQNPLSFTESSKKKAALKKMIAIDKNETSLGSLLNKFIWSKTEKLFGESSSGMGYQTMALKILLDPQNLYNIVYLIISIIAFAFNRLLYSILLLDIVKRSGDLQNIVKSITRNIKQLVKIILLGLVIMYFYALISFTYFRHFFTEDESNNANLYCDNLLLCWTSVINYGLRAQGGLGDVMQKAILNGPDYWSRWVFDLTFYLIIIIILLNIVFGIIIDTFADLRDIRNEQLKKIEETCFVCGLDKNLFDRRGNGWYEHVYREHNVYAYLNFCIYIEKKDMAECNGVEKHVKELIGKKDISFIPQGQAMGLRKYTDDLLLQ